MCPKAHANMGGLAVIDDGLVARRENEIPGAGRSDEEAVRGIGVGFSWQEGALDG
jgi:hypothetical protein